MILDQIRKQAADHPFTAFGTPVQELNMQNPSYIQHHPVHGNAGIMYIYRFDNNYGLVVDRRITDPLWTVQPVIFTGLEVNNYMLDGDAVTGQTAEQVDTAVQERQALPPLTIDHPDGGVGDTQAKGKKGKKGKKGVEVDPEIAYSIETAQIAYKEQMDAEADARQSAPQ